MNIDKDIMKYFVAPHIVAFVICFTGMLLNDVPLQAIGASIALFANLNLIYQLYK